MSDRDDRVVVRMYRGVLGDCFLITVWRDGKAKVAMIDCGVLQNVQPGPVLLDSLAPAVVESVGKDALGKVEATKQAVLNIEKSIVAYLGETTHGRLNLLVLTHDHYDHVAGMTLPDDENVFMGPGLPIDRLWLSWVENPSDSQAQALAARFGKAKQAVALAAEAGRHGVAADSDALAQVRSLAAFIGRVDHRALPMVTDRTKTTTQAIQGMREKIGANTRFLEPGQVIPAEEGIGLKTYVLAPPRNEAKRLFKDSPTGKGPAKEVYLTDLDAAEAVLNGAIAQLHDVSIRAPDELAIGQGKAIEQAVEAELLPFAGPHRRSFPPEAGDKQARPTGWEELRARYEDEANAYRSLSGDWAEAADALALKLDSDTNNSSLVLAFELDEDRVLLFPGDAQIGNWESWGDQLYPVKPAEGERQQTIDNILRRVVFYKVGHHASHNATARARGLELMTHPGLCAAIPVVEAVAKIQGPGRKTPGKGWKMPYAELYARLEEKTHGRIVQGDGDPARERAAFGADGADVTIRHEDRDSGGRWVELTFAL